MNSDSKSVTGGQESDPEISMRLCWDLTAAPPACQVTNCLSSCDWQRSTELSIRKSSFILGKVPLGHQCWWNSSGSVPPPALFCDHSCSELCCCAKHWHPRWPLSPFCWSDLHDTHWPVQGKERKEFLSGVGREDGWGIPLAATHDDTKWIMKLHPELILSCPISVTGFSCVNLSCLLCWPAAWERA